LLAGTGTVRLDGNVNRGSGSERYAYVIAGRGGARQLAHLPGISLVYMSGTAIARSWSTGVSYDQARASGWLLLDAAGRPVVNRQYGWYLADVGSRSYQRRFVSNVTAFLERNGLDGVFLDDVAGDPRVITDGITPAQYQTPGAWKKALVSFVRYVGLTLRARGYYVAANADEFVGSDNRSDTGQLTNEFWVQLAPYVSALMKEYWLQAPSHLGVRSVGTRWDQNWDGWFRLMRTAQRGGADFIGLMYGTRQDQRAMRFGRGSFLLGWDGGTGGAFIYEMTDGSDPYHPAWLSQVGKPIGPRVEVLPDVWKRVFERGAVYVNTTDSAVTVTSVSGPIDVPALDSVVVSAKG